MNQLFEYWEDIKDTIRTTFQMSDVSYNTWIAPLELYKVENHTVTILVVLEGAIPYINKKYTIPFHITIEQFMGEEYEIEFIYPNMIDKNETPAFPEPEKNTLTDNKAIKMSEKYTFETFVVGKNNEFAHAASLAVAENPGELYNPLFLYGGVGLGKTHLMHSIAHYIINHYPEKKVLYVTSESFTNDLIDAIRVGKSGNNNPMILFREKYRNVDVLLIDDIQFIIGKESTQEEFFHTFNDLYSAKKAIIISSDKPPRDFDTLDDRYRTRFEWGITADINPPDFETRMAILRKKIELEHLEYLHIKNDVMEYIASNIDSNIRELEGSLNQLLAMARLQKREINVSLAQDALKDIIKYNKKKELSPSFIMDVVCDHYHIPVEDIISSKRNAEIVIPRQMIMYLCRKITNSKYQDIGSMLKRDHSTIKHGEKAIADMISTDASFANTVEIIMKKINAK